MKRLLITLALFASLSVQAAELGTKFEIANADSFEVSVTTIDEAKEQLGAPVSISTDAEGNQTLWWKYVKVGTFSGRDVRKLSVVFDKDGKMLRVAHREAFK
jgi:hypothetical protein